jgi:AcrR family transcriptional regulator
MQGMARTADAPSRRTVGARTGGRSKRVVTAVLRAAMDELSRTGYAALRVEDVAARAGVNKTTVYRRWPTKIELAGAAIRTFAGNEEPMPDTGTVRGDLLALVQRIVAFVRTPEGDIFTRLVIAEHGEPDVDRLARSLRDAFMVRRAEVITRAQARGELPADIDARVLLDAIFIPVTMRILRYREDVDVATTEAFVDLALTGAKHGAGRTT